MNRGIRLVLARASLQARPGYAFQVGGHLRAEKGGVLGNGRARLRSVMAVLWVEELRGIDPVWGALVLAYFRPHSVELPLDLCRLPERRPLVAVEEALDSTVRLRF